uniref:Uncharacterized protein n=1 Tax=Anguilla anguilla TaxID=7936 RepID=A0A0E9X3L2_ANGAN
MIFQYSSLGIFSLTIAGFPAWVVPHFFSFVTVHLTGMFQVLQSIHNLLQLFASKQLHLKVLKTVLHECITECLQSQDLTMSAKSILKSVEHKGV